MAQAPRQPAPPGDGRFAPALPALIALALLIGASPPSSALAQAPPVDEAPVDASPEPEAVDPDGADQDDDGQDDDGQDDADQDDAGPEDPEQGEQVDAGVGAEGVEGEQEVVAAIDEAKQAYVEDRYDEVVGLLEPLAESPDRVPEVLRSEVYRLLGLAFLSIEAPDRDKAEVWFEALLRLQPDFFFTEGLVRQDAIDLLEETRARLGRAGGEGEPTITTIYIQKEVREHLFWVVFMPFGLGQFQNEEDGKGVFLALTQGLSLGINVGSFAFIETQLRGPTGFFTEEDAALAGSLQTTQFITLGIFVVLVAVGIVDAWYNYSDEVIEIRTLPGPPDELTQRPEDPILSSARQTPMGALPEAGAGSAGRAALPTGEGGDALGALPSPVMLFEMEWRF